VKFLGQQLVTGVEAGLVAAKGYAARIVESGEIKTEIAPIPPAPQLPTVPRRSVTLLQASKWPDVDGTRTGGKLSEADLPLPIAERALALGFALETGSEVVRRMLEVSGRDYAPQVEKYRLDISRPRPVPKPSGDEQTVTTPSAHSIAGARVGVAVAAPVVR
jgi:hypothetical protein